MDCQCPECCERILTLILKGKYDSNGSIEYVEEGMSMEITLREYWPRVTTSPTDDCAYACANNSIRTYMVRLVDRIEEEIPLDEEAENYTINTDGTGWDLLEKKQDYWMAEYYTARLVAKPSNSRNARVS